MNWSELAKFPWTFPWSLQSLTVTSSQPRWNSLNWTEGHTNNTRITPISQDTNSSLIPRIAILKDYLLHNESKHSSNFAFSNPLVSMWVDLARHRKHPTPHPIESCPVAQRVGDLQTVARSLGGPGWRRPQLEGLRNKQTQKTYVKNTKWKGKRGSFSASTMENKKKLPQCMGKNKKFIPFFHQVTKIKTPKPKP